MMVRWLFKKSSMKTGSRVYPTVTEHLELLRNNEENMIDLSAPTRRFSKDDPSVANSHHGAPPSILFPDIFASFCTKTLESIDALKIVSILLSSVTPNVRETA